ncbi:hypothetical protein [Chryseobacterium sp. NKUCC03_KSP]|uniref:hypothetical protein n=1 Tax=Chryseobacterium sp. NKUCC03_KSP TaxID=2842125 RepID=UPI001C5B2A62|nr:hypothetical protein [Chryseobacterium sp. NKUCC03_KSP]MBW3521182.1 hypothetical protein [Chryseobacterium sp. NKUCC03_KSP]
MNYTLDDVKKFILEFTELEYQFGIGFYDISITDEEWKALVTKLKNCYSTGLGYYSIINTIRDESRMTLKRFSNNKNNLKKRRLFLIRKYENPKFGKRIYDTDSNVVFSCFLGSNTEMGAEVYASNTSVGIVNGELKIISERTLNPDKGVDEIEWVYNKRSNVYTEDITIKKDGTLVETLRIFEPEHPTWIADYNQG